MAAQNFVPELKRQLEQLSNELEDPNSYAQRFREIESAASSSPYLLNNPYNVRQFELLLKPHREKIKQMSKTPTITATNPPLEILSGAADGGYSGSDLSYANLVDATVYIACELSALTLIGLTGCRVFVASHPVVSSVVVRDCSRCEFHFQASQARIHSCTACVFRVKCATSPIIERCTDMAFGRYTLRTTPPPPPPEGEEQPVPYTVKDFNWLKANKPSPNWRWIEDKDNAAVAVQSSSPNWTVWI